MSLYFLIRMLEFLLSVLLLVFLCYIAYTFWIFFAILLAIFAVLKKLKSKSKQTVDVTGKGVIITGCDTGFGHDLAKHLERKGMLVYAGVLNVGSEGAVALKKLQSNLIHVVQLDVTKQEDINKAVAYVSTSCKELWGIVNNAGFNIMGDVELCTVDQYKKCTEVNLYGVIRITKAFLPMVRKTKGRIVNVTSVKSRIAWPSDSIYMVSKYGLETLSDSLRLEMKKFGVKVSVVEPGNYGAATACNNPTQLKRMKSELDTIWDEATEEVRCTYGKFYLDNMYNGQENALKSSATSTSPVIEAMEDALTNASPNARYLVTGGNGLVDTRVNLARVYGFLPEFITDFYIVKITGCDKFPVENQEKRD